MTTNETKSVSEMDTEEIAELSEKIEAEADYYDALVSEAESKEVVVEADHRIVQGRRDSQWREVTILYNRPDIGGKSIPMGMLRWGRNKGLSLKSHFKYPEDGLWWATFVVDETLEVEA